jgi:L-ascorbate metabolism protein UlaG (beta-lactamase superfamily)
MERKVAMPVTGPALISAMAGTEAASPVLWWTGRRGFAVKYYSIVFYVDPHLPQGSPVDAADLSNADLILCSDIAPHHFDPASLRAMLEASGRAKVVLPRGAAAYAYSHGIPYHRMTTTDSDLRVEYFRRGIYARIYAVPSAQPALDWTAAAGYPYLGYLIRCGQTTLYHAGGCVPYEGLADRLRPYNVDAALLPVGAGNDSFTPQQAATLAGDIGARWLVPVCADAAAAGQFLNHLLFHRPEQRFKIFSPWESWQIPE